MGQTYAFATTGSVGTGAVSCSVSFEAANAGAETGALARLNCGAALSRGGSGENLALKYFAGCARNLSAHPTQQK
jgi:hypothetical protein